MSKKIRRSANFKVRTLNGLVGTAARGDRNSGALVRFGAGRQITTS